MYVSQCFTNWFEAKPQLVDTRVYSTVVLCKGRTNTTNSQSACSVFFNIEVICENHVEVLLSTLSLEKFADVVLGLVEPVSEVRNASEMLLVKTACGHVYS